MITKIQQMTHTGEREAQQKCNLSRPMSKSIQISNNQLISTVEKEQFLLFSIVKEKTHKRKVQKSPRRVKLYQLIIVSNTILLHNIIDMRKRDGKTDVKYSQEDVKEESLTREK